jgi:hypothetical protein
MHRQQTTEITRNDPDPRDEDPGRLQRIQALWDELRAAPRYSQKYEALMQRIRREADAFRQRLD